MEVITISNEKKFTETKENPDKGGNVYLA